MKHNIQISTERARKAKAFKALGIAKVVKPLRHILAKHTVRKTDGHGNVSVELNYVAHAAVTWARRGWGCAVQHMALQDI